MNDFSEVKDEITSDNGNGEDAVSDDAPLQFENYRLRFPIRAAKRGDEYVIEADNPEDDAETFDAEQFEQRFEPVT